MTRCPPRPHGSGIPDGGKHRPCRGVPGPGRHVSLLYCHFSRPHQGLLNERGKTTTPLSSSKSPPAQHHLCPLPTSVIFGHIHLNPQRPFHKRPHDRVRSSTSLSEKVATQGRAVAPWPSFIGAGRQGGQSFRRAAPGKSKTGQVSVDPLAPSPSDPPIASVLCQSRWAPQRGDSPSALRLWTETTPDELLRNGPRPLGRPKARPSLPDLQALGTPRVGALPELATAGAGKGGPEAGATMFRAIWLSVLAAGLARSPPMLARWCCHSLQGWGGQPLRDGSAGRSLKPGELRGESPSSARAPSKGQGCHRPVSLPENPLPQTLPCGSELSLLPT